MKNPNIDKVNGLGRACHILCRIGMILCIIGTVLLLMVNVFVLVFPMNKINISGNADAMVTLSISDKSLPIGTLHITDGGKGINYNSDGISIDSDEIDFDGVWKLDVEQVEADDNSATYKLTGDFADLDKGHLKFNILMEVFEAMFKVALTGVVLGFAAVLFKKFAKCETPFSDDIVKSMKTLGWIFIGYAVLSGINIAIIVVALAMLMIAYVFAHGSELQKQSDETI